MTLRQGNALTFDPTVSTRSDYAPAMYTNRTTFRWWLRMLRFKLKHRAPLRGTWDEARYTRRTQKAMPK